MGPLYNTRSPKAAYSYSTCSMRCEECEECAVMSHEPAVWTARMRYNGRNESQPPEQRHSLT